MTHRKIANDVRGFSAQEKDEDGFRLVWTLIMKAWKGAEGMKGVSNEVVACEGESYCRK